MVVPLQNQLFINKTFAGIPQNLTNENYTTMNKVNITLGYDAPVSDCVEMNEGKIDLGNEVKFSCTVLT